MSGNNKDFKVKNGIHAPTYHESVGTVTTGSVAYGLDAATYDGKSFSVASEEATPTGIFLKPDGTKVYICGSNGDEVNEYDLSTAYDISTATFNQLFSIVTEEALVTQVFFKPDGTSMYIVGYLEDTVFQYTLSNAWDISTASYSTKFFDVGAQEAFPRGLSFKPDGTKMYISGHGSGNNVYQYSLSTAWDVSTASYDSVSFTVPEITQLRGTWFSSDGTILYLSDGTDALVVKATLSTAWDISTASLTSETLDVSHLSPSVHNVYGNSDGTKLYILDATDDIIFQYSTVLTTNTLDLSTGSVFEITPSSYTQISLSNPPASGPVCSATLLINYAKSNIKLASQEERARLDTSATITGNEYETFFKPDGTKMYILDSTEIIWQYSLSTAWDVSTATYDTVNFTLTEGSAAEDIYFKPDGTKLYNLDINTDTVYQYSLSTAWDVSTATYDTVSFGTTGETTPQCLEFSADGTSLYVGGSAGNGIDQYTLTTAWDLSTAGSGVFKGFDQDVDGLALSSDGAYLAVFHSSLSSPDLDTIKLYSLYTAWDVSTAAYLNDRSLESENEATIQGIAFGDADKYLYITDIDKIIQYASAESYPITYDDSVSFKALPLTVRPGETDVVTLTTRDGGTSYRGTLVIDGAR
jgi:DNA-binding beta-propeller fold protein YncE